jgi:aspartyl-tRNA(Asn)/glutamyl-tRNA(Gln) amidotransferase subunit B
MAEPYKIVVGLEVHVQLLTKTKLFCGCPNRFGLPPNSATCPVCLGMPGTLPVMNRKAFQLAMRAALALNCQIANFTKWDRKNYYYPDLPKNYQISQYDLPFSHDGFVEINVHPDPKKGHTPKKVGIIRAHLEEDAGKNMHDETGRGGDSLVDLNRTGTPLLEIVSHPDINTPDEAISYLEELRLMLRELGVSDCEMQEGSLRCDVNVNIHIPLPRGSGVFATAIVEVKNLNSFRSVGRAITHTAERMYSEWKEKHNSSAYAILNALAPDYDDYVEKVIKPAKHIDDIISQTISKKLTSDPKDNRKSTAGWDDKRGAIVIQRHKEEAADYRYFPEPDLVPVVVSKEQVEAVRAEMGELPSVQRARLQSQYGVTAYDAEVLTAKGRKLVAYFEALAAALGDGKAAANRLSDLVFPALTERKEEIEEFPVSAVAFAEFLKKTGPLSKQDRVDLFKHVLEHNVGVDAAMDATGIKPVAFDEATLRAAVLASIAANPKVVADYKAGKVQAANKIKGEVMKANKGAPNDLVQKLMEEELAKV